MWLRSQTSELVCCSVGDRQREEVPLLGVLTQDRRPTVAG